MSKLSFDAQISFLNLFFLSSFLPFLLDRVSVLKRKGVAVWLSSRFLPYLKKTYLHSDSANRGVENRGVEKRATREIGRAFPDCKVTRGVTTTRVFSPYTLPPLPASIQRSSIVLLKPASRLPFNGYAKSVDLRQCWTPRLPKTRSWPLKSLSTPRAGFLARNFPTNDSPLSLFPFLSFPFSKGRRRLRNGRQDSQSVGCGLDHLGTFLSLLVRQLFLRSGSSKLLHPLNLSVSGVEFHHLSHFMGSIRHSSANHFVWEKRGNF